MTARNLLAARTGPRLGTLGRTSTGVHGLLRTSSLKRGLSLVELLTTITIASLMLATGVPYMADYINNSRLRESAYNLQAEALFAQSEAIKRNAVIRLTTNAGTVQVHDARDSAALVLIRERNLHERVSAAATSVEFGSRGYPIDRSTTPPTEFVPANVNLSLNSASCGGQLRCPRIRVAAGGAITLCADYVAGC